MRRRGQCDGRERRKQLPGSKADAARAQRTRAAVPSVAVSVSALSTSAGANLPAPHMPGKAVHLEAGRIELQTLERNAAARMTTARRRERVGSGLLRLQRFVAGCGPTRARDLIYGLVLAFLQLGIRKRLSCARTRHRGRFVQCSLWRVRVTLGSAAFIRQLPAAVAFPTDGRLLERIEKSRKRCRRTA